MKRIITVLFATGLLAALATGCKEEYKTYSDAEYVLFADTLATYAVLQDQDYFSVPVSSTVACDYDRTFGVEIIDQGSNAVEGKHYRLLSNTITIKAGSRKADVQVRGLYDNIEDTDSLGFILKLVMPAVPEVTAADKEDGLRGPWSQYSRDGPGRQAGEPCKRGVNPCIN